MTLRLYDYAASGNCYKVRLLLAQLGLEYERVPIDIFGGDTLTEEYARVNPARQTPVLERDGAEPLSESNAILIHLAEGTEYLRRIRANAPRPCAGSSSSRPRSSPASPVCASA
jgi:glutathione S-transferase